MGENEKSLNQGLIDKMISKYRGVKDNPLNGKTFTEIQIMAEKENGVTEDGRKN